MFNSNFFIFLCVLVANRQQFALGSTAAKAGFPHSAVGVPRTLAGNLFSRGLHYPGHNKPYYNPVGPAIPIVSYSNDHPGDGSYSYSFTTADGKQVEESGFVKDEYIDHLGEPQGTQVVQGSYSYFSPDGTPVQVSYTADENGFRTSGVQISSDGNIAVPVASNIRRDINNILDPHYNRYDHFSDRNSFNSDPHNQYKHDKYQKPHGFHGFRAPYDSSKYNLNDPYNQSYNRKPHHNSWLNNSVKN